MKKTIPLLGLCLSLALTGCADMLERSYTFSSPHVDRPTTAEDPSILRVENYRELVSAVLYLVSEGAEEGVIQLHDYSGPVESDLTAACLEVTAEDPLGAYAVDYIQHEYTRVVSYYQATLDIHYRRTQEQVRSMVRVTGTGAIRTELREALSRFAPEVVLRVAYFAEDEGSIAQLLRQTYYDTPGSALGCPEAQISLYPDSGRERVVEILLTYPAGAEELRRRSEALAGEVKALSREEVPPSETPEEWAEGLLERLWSRAEGDSAAGPTAYHALVEGAADHEGMALACLLLLRQEGREGRIVEGALNGEPRFWIAVELGEEERYLDPAGEVGRLYTAEELFDAGFRWSGGPQDPVEAEPSLAEAPAGEEPSEVAEPPGENGEENRAEGQ